MLLFEILLTLLAEFQDNATLRDTVDFEAFGLMIKIVQRCEPVLVPGGRSPLLTIPQSLRFTLSAALDVNLDVVDMLWATIRPILKGLLPLPTDAYTDDMLGKHGVPERIGESPLLYGVQQEADRSWDRYADASAAGQRVRKVLRAAQS